MAPYPDGMNLAAPGGPEAPALTTAEERAIEMEEAVMRCEREMAALQETLSKLEDSTDRDALAQIDALTDRLRVALGKAVPASDKALATIREECTRPGLMNMHDALNRLQRIVALATMPEKQEGKQ